MHITILITVMKNSLYLIKNSFVLIAFILISCGGGGNGTDDPNPTPESISPPESATLIFPERNKECTEGTIVNESQSEVIFEWNLSENTDSYELNIINLNLNSTLRISSNTTQAAATIARGAPYEWFVISKAEMTNVTTESERWRFYNAGAGVQNYAPFPAEAIRPQRGEAIDANGNSITLEWNAEDVDNDIEQYEVLFGTDPTPVNSLGTTTSKTIDVDVTPETNYYWRILTTDSNSNTSNSEIFLFKVN